MTVRGLSGSLLSHDALVRTVPETLAGLLDEAGREHGRRTMRAWHLPLRSALGPTAGARVVFDRVALPLVSHLGFRPLVVSHPSGPPYAVLQAGARDAAVVLATAWGQELAGAWRDAVRRGIGHDVRWCLCTNGVAVRLFDAGRVYSRRFADFDLALALDDDTTFAVLWGLLHSRAMGSDDGPPVLDRAVALCERHRASVRDSLKGGVHEALLELAAAFLSTAGRRHFDDQVVDESLIVIYRVLFLLFAEARGLVPHWHPVYRAAYTIEALRSFVESREHAAGVWEALQAIARLAHKGCGAGTLRIPPFNGRLFSPTAAPLADSLSLDDGAVRRALLALTTRRGQAGRERIAYADLGVEQLGAVYEHILDFVPFRRGDGTFQLRPGGKRKATGTFYTPRALTEYVVRRTLAPLVEHSNPDEILRIRILDPAMGSGAFLVAACRYLAHAYEQALVRETGITPADIADADRTAFRRTIAQRCLFGVDINPMAVQLARLSLWLATLAGDRPLTFLDHHLRTGDSLVGASLDDIHRQPPGGKKGAIGKPLPLFAVDDFHSGLRSIVPPRLALAQSPDDTLEQVRHKERTLTRLSVKGSPLDRWTSAADLWCAGWFSSALNARTFDALLRQVIDGQGPLPAQTSKPLLEEAAAAAATGRFFHWTLEFPEAFFGEDGLALDDRGFDAVLGNPPWDMLRRDRASAGPSAGFTDFVRRSGIYRLQGDGHTNLYQLFIERTLSLLKRDGRLGLIVPSGLSTDHGCARLRRELFERTTIDTFMTLENRDGIFPIHRGLKFTLFTLTNAGRTGTLCTRVGVRAVDTLDRLTDTGIDPDAVPLPVAFLQRFSGDDLAVPEIQSREDLHLVSQLVLSFPALGDAAGWQMQFGRELNASDDRPHFVEAAEGTPGFPIVEGKHVQPFRVDVAAARYRIAPAVAARLLPRHERVLRPRLAYRDVASAANRLTLIAAIVPSGVVTTHTLFCVKEPPDLRSQYFLCGIFNSFVSNYLVRLRVGTHVTAALVDRLPVPKPPRESRVFRQIVELSRRLSKGHAEAGPSLQALIARLYGLSDTAFAHVLGKFPLVPPAERDAALSAFRCIVR